MKSSNQMLCDNCLKQIEKDSDIYICSECVWELCKDCIVHHGDVLFCQFCAPPKDLRIKKP